MTWLREHATRIIPTLVVAAAVLVYASGVWGLPEGRYNSPDEAANAFFATRVAQGKPVAVYSPLNVATHGTLVRPRSTVVAGAYLVPASFLGFPVWGGSIARVVGKSVLPYLSALGAALGLTAFYLLLSEFLGKRSAVLGVALLAIQPMYWYYHSRGLFHNALFFDVLLLAWWLTLRLRRRPTMWAALAAGLAYGVAVSFRLSEAPWVVAALVVWVLCDPELRAKFKQLPMIVVGACLGLLPVIVAQSYVHGAATSLGYPAPGTPGGTVPGLWGLLFPFGVHLRTIWDTVWSTVAKLQWWFAVPAVAGFAVLVVQWQKLEPKVRAFTLALMLAGFWLVLMYGSLPLVASPDPAAGVTLGEAHARYWLPLSVVGIWFTVYVLSLQQRRQWVMYTVFILSLMFSYLSVVNEPHEGIATVRRNVRTFQATSQDVLAQVPPGSVIVAGIADKIFWPEREVIINPNEPDHFRIISELVHSGTRVFSYQNLVAERVSNIYGSTSLALYGLELDFISVINDGYGLYEFKSVP